MISSCWWIRGLRGVQFSGYSGFLNGYSTPRNKLPSKNQFPRWWHTLEVWQANGWRESCRRLWGNKQKGSERRRRWFAGPFSSIGMHGIKLQETINLLTERDYFALTGYLHKIKQASNQETLAICCKKEQLGEDEEGSSWRWRKIVQGTHFCKRARDGIVINICCV